MPSPAMVRMMPVACSTMRTRLLLVSAMIEIAVTRDRHRVRRLQRRLRRLLHVAVEAGNPRTRDRDDLPVGAVDAADAIVLRVGHVQIAVGADGDIGRRRKLQRRKLPGAERRRLAARRLLVGARVELADHPLPPIGKEQVAIRRHRE